MSANCENNRKLYIIGNGFDLEHNLPTSLNNDFKRIASKYESEDFWNIYQTRESEIWSDFENLLGNPDFNSLEDIFSGYKPDYLSDRESDRDSIINQVDLNGNLENEITEFAKFAEDELKNTEPSQYIKNIIDLEGIYISFNYTHTLEEIYGIPKYNVLHIHGEVGKNNLVVGYPKGKFVPEKYEYDVRMKGRGPYVDIDIEKYIDELDDYYEREAWKKLYDKCKSFYKEENISLLKSFLEDKGKMIDEIIVYGHSCKIDYGYFDYLNERCPKSRWIFYIFDDTQEGDVSKLVSDYHIKDYEFERICKSH